MRAVYEVLDEIARRQRGLVARWQLLASGWTAGAIRCALASGHLIEVHPGVYRLPGFTMGAAASHRAALIVWGLLDGVQPVEITVLRPQGPVPRDVVAHRPLDPRPDLVVGRNGVRVTTPARALVDGGRGAPGLAARSMRRGRPQPSARDRRGSRTAIDEHSRRGRNGVVFGAATSTTEPLATGARRASSSH